MAFTTEPAVHPDALELARLLRPAWGEVSDEIPMWHLRMEELADPPADPPEPTDPADPPTDPPTDPEDPTDPPEDPKDQNDPAYLKREARKHEREKKAALKREADLKKRLDEIDAANLSEQEKAIKAAREEARTEALTEAEKDRRADKLELEITRLAIGSGVEIGEGDKARKVKFSDAEDVQMRLERAMASGDVESEDIYKDGKVDKAALTEWLTDLAVAKPGWLVNGNGAAANGKPAGDADAGKGAAPVTESVEKHLTAVRRNKS